ncbi:MAG: chorismate synthase [Thermoplasmata archaeon]|nr:chorismate synthase [Thermoplasmata archaeon]
MTVFGASHAPEVGAVVEGVPAQFPVDVAAIQAALDRRRPLGRRLGTQRHEADRLVVDSGIDGGRATGAAIRLHVANTDARSRDYQRIRDTPRPGHADYPARVRYGADADLAGGGIFSGRMTVGLVAAGAIASGLLAPIGVEVVGFARSVGGETATVSPDMAFSALRELRDGNEVGCPDPPVADRMERLIAEVRRQGDSVGGTVEVRARGLPVGMGEPFFDSIESVVAHLAFSVPAVKGVEFGAGFAASRMSGSEHNDPYEIREGRVALASNHAGGVLGGLADGADLVARFAVKPTSSIAKEQATVDLVRMKPARIVVPGRHDPCIVPRAVPVLEAIVAIALADLAMVGGYLG